MNRLTISILSYFLVSVAGFAGSPQIPSNPIHFKRAIEIVFENESYSAVIKQQDFAVFAKQGALLQNLSAVTHPSQGNYFAMIAGDYFGVMSDGSIDLNYNHLGDLLESAGLDWRVYAESYPGNCFTGEQSSTYFRKHNPFISFTNVSQNSFRCKKIVNAKEFELDLTAKQLPAFVMYIPDINNDGHNTNVDFAGKWLTKFMASLLSNKQFMSDTLVILTFDESSNLFGSNQVFTVLLGGAVKPGAINTQVLNHSSLLRLIEDEFGLASLGRGDKSSAVIQGIWQ